MERPPVTVGDPARPGTEPDLLVGGEAEGLGPVGRRRLKALVAVVAVGGLALLVPDEVRERRAADAEQRRLAGVLDLAVEPSRGPEQRARYDEVRQTAELDVVVVVRNDGPRGVRVLRGTLGPYALPGDVHVPAGRTAALVLQRSVPCAAADPQPVRVSSLQLQARTGAGVRDAVLRVDLDLPADAARRACGPVPPETAVSVRYANRQERDEAYEVGLEVRLEVTDRAGAADRALVADAGNP